MEKLIAREIPEGDGVTVKRLFPLQRNELPVDPFVLWDDFSIGAGSGFPMHGHRGFEAITYLFAGSMNHTDNLGNNETVSAGGAQRFTAGKGIRHSEMPADSDITRGIQLWINLPRSLKQVDPEYQQVDSADVPATILDGVTTRHITGEQGPVQLKTETRFEDIMITSGHSYRTEVPQHMQGLVYLHDGSIMAGEEHLLPGEALLLLAGDTIDIEAIEDSRLMLALGKPHHEPVYLNGGSVD